MAEIDASPWAGSLMRDFGAKGRDRPSVTVGICAHTEFESALRLIKTSLCAEPTREMKVVVVTPNKAIAQELLGGDSRVSVILEPKREGKTSAMNRMLRAVDHGMFVYASADIVIDRDVIPRLVSTLLSNPRYGAVIAHVVPTNCADGIMGKVSALIWQLFNNTNSKLDEESKLSQANDLYVFWRNLVAEIPVETINDDAYIATAIRRRGFLVKKGDMKVYISGPTTPVEYVIQRSRIILGHLQTMRYHRVIPSVFEFTFFSSPLRNMRILVRTVANKGIGQFAATLAASQLELISWVHAFASRALHKDVRIWTEAQGTKRVPLQERLPMDL